jgi:anti-sigma factor RsiW
MTTLQSPAPHDAALLLPWYVNGTLAESEHRAVEAHLRECAACSGELDSIREVREQARGFFAASPVPARLRTEVLSRVKAQASRPSRTLLQSLADALAVRPPRWAAAAAVAIIVVQAGALGWFALNAGPEPQVRSRSVEAPHARIRIVFNPRAPEEEIRAGLIALGGRIIDGPSLDGAYVVELPAVEPTVLSQRLRELRARPGLVERIENAAP